MGVAGKMCRLTWIVARGAAGGAQLAAALVLGGLASPTFADVKHGGFTVSDRRLSSAEKAQLPNQVTASTLEQLRMIESLALAPDLVQFFQSVELSYDPALSAQAGVFSVAEGRGEVRIRPVRLDSERPVVLHELLHAYHYFKLGLDHPEVISAYRAALDDTGNRAFSRPVYFLGNTKEFFAVTASIYLVGNIKQPPFTCQGVTANAAYLAFLRSHFGPGKCGR